MTYERFEQLPVWQAAIELAASVYALTGKPQFRRRPRAGIRRRLFWFQANVDLAFGSRILYDALLDGLEDEPISRADETLDLVEDPVEALDVEDDLDRAVLDDDEEHDPELDAGRRRTVGGGRGRILVRRSGAHVLDADGRDSAADPAAGGRPGQADRVDADAVSPQGARVRLRHADGREGVAAGPRRRVALRPHGAGLGDRSTREAPDSRPPAAQSAHAWKRCSSGTSGTTTSPRASRAPRRSAARPGAGWDAAGGGRCGWSRNSACARSGSSR